MKAIKTITLIVALIASSYATQVRATSKEINRTEITTQN